MPQIVARTRMGPETYEVNTGVTGVTGGLLVEFDGTTGKIKLAVVDSTAWLGVALYDAQPVGTTGSTTTWGYTTVDTSVPQPQVAVAWHGTLKLKNSSAGALNPGVLVYPAANGEVKGAVGGRAVGQVVQPTAAVAGALVLVRLF